MSILQNKLIWTSIEALHDEATAATASSTSKTVIIESHSAAVLQTVRIDSHDPSTDVMSRINNLMQQLDNDHYTPIEKPAISESTVPYSFDTTVQNKVHPEPADNEPVKELQAIQNPIIIPNTTDDDESKSLIVTKTNNTDVDETLDSSKQNDDTLINIAEAIDRARQMPAETTHSAKTNDITPQIDINDLTATLVNEMRSTVSNMLTTELSTVVKQAVNEAFQNLPNIKENQTKKVVKKPKSPKTSKVTATKKTASRSTTKKKSTAPNLPI
jgi:hypothetical protein